MPWIRRHLEATAVVFCFEAGREGGLASPWFAPTGSPLPGPFFSAPVALTLDGSAQPGTSLFARVKTLIWPIVHNLVKAHRGPNCFRVELNDGGTGSVEARMEGRISWEH